MSISPAEVNRATTTVAAKESTIVLPIRSAVFALTLVLFAAGPLAAAGGSFIPAGQIDIRELLPAPPADGSAVQADELAELHRIERERTPEQIAAARADEAADDMFIYRSVLGPEFSARSLPLTAALSHALAASEPGVVNPGKRYFDRKRPFAYDPTLHNVCEAKRGSYPSGHTTNGYVQGLVLAMMVPEYRDKIFARADAYAHNRLVCGVHYPSDLAASKSVAYAMLGAVASNPTFEAQFAAAQAELRAALKLKPAS
jgi:acid phosphatase (class A)